ncbi:MAG: BON domain-containing protein [Gammaproteobacteria bacterium]
MNTLRKCTVAVLMLSALGLAACQNHSGSGPAATAGKKIDQAGRDVGHAVGTAAHSTTHALGQAARSTGRAISDTAITAKIQAAILASPGLRIMKIDVTTTKGVVTLTGTVRSAKDSDRAAGLARAVDGVKGVHNDLTVVSSGSD